MIYLDELPKPPRQYYAEIMDAICPDHDNQPPESDFMLSLGMLVEAVVPPPIQSWVIDYCLHEYRFTPQARRFRRESKERRRREHFSKRKFTIDDRARRGKCRYCKADLYWQPTKSGKMMPLDSDGTSHFETCPYSSQVPRSR